MAAQARGVLGTTGGDNEIFDPRIPRLCYGSANRCCSRLGEPRRSTSAGVHHHGKAAIWREAILALVPTMPTPREQTLSTGWPGGIWLPNLPLAHLRELQDSRLEERLLG